MTRYLLAAATRSAPASLSRKVNRATCTTGSKPGAEISTTSLSPHSGRPGLPGCVP